MPLKAERSGFESWKNKPDLFVCSCFKKLALIISKERFLRPMNMNTEYQWLPLKNKMKTNKKLRPVFSKKVLCCKLRILRYWAFYSLASELRIYQVRLFVSLHPSVLALNHYRPESSQTYPTTLCPRRG